VGEEECGTKLPISLHYLAQGEGVAVPPLAPTYQAMMLEWIGDSGGLPRHHGEPLVHLVPHVPLQGEGECSTKLPISLHYLAQGEGQGGGLHFLRLLPPTSL
jgi:hypothetical protein